MALSQIAAVRVSKKARKISERSSVAERYVYTVLVGGSNPSARTILKLMNAICRLEKLSKEYNNISEGYKILGQK